MSKDAIRRRGDLEIDEDPKFQNGIWAVERGAWAALALLLLAGLAGVFGHGPISRAEARAPDGSLTVEHPRLARRESPDDLELRFRPAGAERTIDLDGEFARVFLIEEVTPEPARQESRGRGVRLTFDSAAAGGEQVVSLSVRPRRPAFPARAAVSLDGGRPVELSVLVFP